MKNLFSILLISFTIASCGSANYDESSHDTSSKYLIREMNDAVPNGGYRYYCSKIANPPNYYVFTFETLKNTFKVGDTIIINIVKATKYKNERDTLH